MADSATRLTEEQMRHDLIDMVGEASVQTHEGWESEYRNPFRLAVSPTDEGQVQKILAWASAHGVRLTPRGGGTKDAFGSAGFDADIVLDMRQMSGILHYSVGDLTVTLLPGTPMGDLQRALRREGQFLPLDTPWGNISTVGGVVASNASGPRRALYGSARDHLIASRVAYPDGTVIRTGARVVKNVAGYDMNKLFIGSMGTIGVLTEVTFKIRPMASYSGLLLMRAESPDALPKLAAALSDSQLEPSAVEWLNARSGSRISGHTVALSPFLLVAFEDVERSVLYQMNWMEQACRECGAAIAEQILGSEGTEAMFTRLAEGLPCALEIPEDKLVVGTKLLSLMSDVPAIGELAEQKALEQGLDLEFQGGCLSGISRAVIRAEWEQERQVMAWLESVSDKIVSLGGRQVIDLAPRRLKYSLNVWGPESGDWVLMRGIKNRIDPRGTLNPGRFAGGI